MRPPVAFTGRALNGGMEKCIMAAQHRKGLGGALILGLAALWVPASGKAADGSPNPFIVTLPNGEAYDVSAQAGAIQWRTDSGILSGAVGQLLAQGLIGDAAAVIAYAARYRPEAAPALSVLAAASETEHAVIGFSELALKAVLTAPGVDPVAVRNALSEAPIPAALLAGLHGLLAGAIPPPGGEVREGDVAAETERAADPPGLREESLPDLLRIGGGALGGAVREPGFDSGAS
jgi:hypothetical protein